MRLGVDFGTTRTVVALADRGNYPLLSFPDENGDEHEYIPCVIARSERGMLYGFEAGASGLPLLRSVKRQLASPVNAASTVRVGDGEFPLLDILTGFLFHVASAIRTTTGIGTEPLEAVVGVPAHANSAQRFLTLEAFRRAGFHVLAMLNEPSAAGFEYTHRHSSMLSSKRTKVLVYDLGGGTFDASLVVADGYAHEVLASRGNNALGGDDFDEVLAKLALAKAGLSHADVCDQWEEILSQAREAKEALRPQTRTINLDVAGRDVSISSFEFYDAVAPLIDETLRSLAPLLEGDEAGDRNLGADVAGLYVVGGGSELPAIARLLRESYGRRVRRSPYSAGSTAIGLAIAADPESRYSLIDRLSRGFGVFRERESGDSIAFDTLLSPDEKLEGEIRITRRYVAAHNVGIYRFAEYSKTDDNGIPVSGVLPLGVFAFPFDPTLRDPHFVQSGGVEKVEVHRREGGHLIEEVYEVDNRGIIRVTIRDLEDGYELSTSLGR